MDQIVPKNIDAERAVIACCCVAEDSYAYDLISNVIKQDDFYEYKNGLIFKAISSLVSQGKTLDLISVCEELKTQGNLDEVGGTVDVMCILDKAETPTSIKYFANIVKEKSKLRQLIRSFRNALEDALSEQKTAQEISAKVENCIIDIDVGSDDTAPVESSVIELKTEFQDMLDGKYTQSSVPTHIGDLDQYLGCRGIGLGEVMVVAAPTSCGKSQLALNICCKNAVKDNTPCGIVSLEMPQKQVMKRMASCVAGVQIDQIKDRVITDAHMDKVNDALDDLSSSPIYTIHSCKSAEDLCSQIRALHRRHKVKLVVIDYLQLIPWNPSSFSKVEAVSDMSHKIKQLALDLNIAIILLSQVNREGSKAEYGLELYHLRDSGDIENDADVILLMWPTDKDLEESRRTDASGTYALMQYKIAKNREGQRDLKGQFKFFNQYGRFY